MSMNPVRLLIIDDDMKFTRLLSEYLKQFGYTVDAVHDGQKGLESARAGGYSVIILDVMLPKMNGWDVLRELRRESQTPVLLLTALGDEPDRIAGLEIGADDYLPKTFSMRELLARLRAVLRRSEQSAKARRDQELSAFTCGDLCIDAGAHSVTLNGCLLSLTATEFALLESLARAPGRVKSREQLLLEVGDRDFEAFDRSIDVHIASLRRKLGDDARAPRLIETIRGVGYRMRTAASEQE